MTGHSAIHARMLVPNDIVAKSMRVAYGIHGPRSDNAGEPAVLIHGTPSSSVIWRNIVPRLTAAGHTTYVYDMLGFGASERPRAPEVDTSVSGQVDVLRSLLDAWGLRDVHVVGHDIGGAVTQRFGTLHPDRVRSITLMDCVSFDSWPSERTRRQIADGLEALIAAPAAQHREHFRAWLLSTVEDKDAFIRGQVMADILSWPFRRLARLLRRPAP